ncbi:MAG: hypothetical protein R8M45_10140 [Ghiorsea sp.]
MKKATSLQGSLSHDSEAESIRNLDQSNSKSLMFGQGLRTLASDTQARKPWFFHALKSISFIDRGGVVQYKSGLSV